MKIPEKDEGESVEFITLEEIEDDPPPWMREIEMTWGPPQRTTHDGTPYKTYTLGARSGDGDMETKLLQLMRTQMWEDSKHKKLVVRRFPHIVHNTEWGGKENGEILVAARYALEDK